MGIYDPPLETLVTRVPMINSTREEILERIKNLTLSEVIQVRIDGKTNYLDTSDIVVVIFLLGLVMAVGVYASIQANEGSIVKVLNIFTGGNNDSSDAVAVNDGSDTSEDDGLEKGEGDVDKTDLKNEATNFFLADKSMAFWYVGTSLFASNIGSEHFVGQSGDGARRGLPVAMYEWYAALLLLALGWVFGPVYRRSGIYTTPEFLEKRFGAGSRHYLSFITCIMYVVAKLSASIYGGSLVLTTALGWNLYASAGACIFLSALYTISGGLRAVMYTDFFQTFVFIIGGMIVMGITLNYVGGYGGLQERLKAQGKGDFWQLWRPADDPEYPVTGMLFGQPFTSIWYWCMDQDLVQRILAAKNDMHAKAGCTMAAVLKILPPFLMIIPGIAVSTLFAFRHDDDKALDAEFSDNIRPDQAYPIILTQLMPAGIRGVMIASIMTALMSSLDSVFNAGSTIVSNDIYSIFRPNATAKELARVGQIATVVFAVLSFLWIPIIQSGSGLYRVVVEIQGYLGPPFGVLICLAVFWGRSNEYGALYGLIVGGVMGITRLVVNVGLSSVVDPETLGWFFTLPFLHYSLVIAMTSLVVNIVVSLLTSPPEDVDRFLVRWQDIFKVHEDSLDYSGVHHILVQGSAISVLIATFTLWLAFL